jgi:hypothetical protein
MIIFDSVDAKTYLAERLDQPFKSNNGKYIEHFNSIIHNAIKDILCDGFIKYKNGGKKEKIDSPFLYYNYGSPAPWLGKLLPEGYGFTYFEPNDIYKNCHIESGIQKKLLDLYDSGNFTRYKQITTLPDKLPDNYILVVMQNTGSTVWYNSNFTDLANDIMAWSRENKKNVIFKWHNGCIDHHNPSRWFNDLKEKSQYASIDFTSPLSVLIKQCEMVWTASSMSGIEALICNKPVAVFGQTEYMEMAKKSVTPDDAIKAKIPEDLDRWFTYYVRKYCINIYDKSAVDLVRNRVLNYFEKGKPLNELILS